MGCCCGKNKETEEINLLDLESGVVDVTKDDGTLDSKILGYERSVVESFLAGVVALLVIAALVIFVMYQYGYIYSANTSQNVEIGVEEASSSNTASADAVLSQSSMLSGEQKNLIASSPEIRSALRNSTELRALIARILEGPDPARALADALSDNKSFALFVHSTMVRAGVRAPADSELGELMKR
eukprot:240632_1